MQLNRVGVGLIAFFLLFGVAMAILPFALGVPGQVAGILALVGVIWALVALGLLWFARRQQAKAAHQDWVFRNGIKGTATIVDRGGTNTTINEMPLLKMELELDIPGRDRRRVSRREVMPVFTAARMQPGLVLAAYANPEDPDDFVLVW